MPTIEEIPGYYNIVRDTNNFTANLDDDSDNECQITENPLTAEDLEPKCDGSDNECERDDERDDEREDEREGGERDFNSFFDGERDYSSFFDNFFNNFLDSARDFGGESSAEDDSDYEPESKACGDSDNGCDDYGSD